MRLSIDITTNLCLFPRVAGMLGRGIQVIVLSLLVSLPFSRLSAQPDGIPADLNWGEEYKEASSAYLSQILHNGPGGIFAIREKRSGMISAANAIYLERYNENMRLQRSEQINLKYQGKLRSYEKTFFLNGRLFLFTSFYNEAHENRYLFMEEVDVRRLDTGRDLEMMAESPGKDRDNAGRFDFRFSSDSSRVLIYNQLPQRRQEPERFHLRVFDNNMDLLWNREVEMPYRDDAFRIEEYRVDESGKVYLLGVLFHDGSRTRRGGKPTYEYVLLVFSPDSDEARQIEIDPGDFFITDLTFRAARNGDIVCAGFYSLKGTYSVKGTCYFLIDGKKFEVTRADMAPFEFEFVTEFMSDRKAERARRSGDGEGPELYNYGLDELILRSDGGALLVAEQFYTTSYYVYDWRGMATIHYLYNYNDIVVVNISPGGEIEWATRIPKRQETVDDGGYFSSYSMAVVRDRLFFVYNDNPRNLGTDRSSGRVYNYNGSSSIITLAEVRRDGELTRYPLQSNRDIPVISRPKMCKQTGSREMIIYGERNRRYMFGRLTF